jgi:putative transposase
MLFSKTNSKGLNMGLKTSNSIFSLYYHIILTVKYRKKLVDTYDIFIKNVISDIAANKNFSIEKMESDKDHIHILVSAKPNISPSQIVSNIKQVTTYQLWQNYSSELSKEFYKKHTFWSPIYFICSVGSVSKEAIERYIENQRNPSTT